MTYLKASWWMLDKIPSSMCFILYNAFPRENGAVDTLAFWSWFWDDLKGATRPCYGSLSTRLAYGTQLHYVTILKEVTKTGTQRLLRANFASWLIKGFTDKGI